MLNYQIATDILMQCILSDNFDVSLTETHAHSHMTNLAIVWDPSVACTDSNSHQKSFCKKLLANKLKKCVMQPAHFMPFLFYLKVLKGKGVQRWLSEQINKKKLSAWTIMKQLKL